MESNTQTKTNIRWALLDTTITGTTKYTSLTGPFTIKNITSDTDTANAWRAKGHYVVSLDFGNAISQYRSNMRDGGDPWKIGDVINPS